jgi:type IV pilus assembly protein PilO
MALLPQDPADQKRMLGIILPVALGVLFYLYIHRSRVAELGELEERITDMETQNEIARTRMENLDVLRADLVRAERRFAVLERLVPTGAEIPEIYEAIASESEALNLSLRNVIPVDAEADSAGYFLYQNWEMEVEGAYHDVGEFLARVASFDRIVRPQVREIRPASDPERAGRAVSVYFQLETFVLPPAATRAAEEGEGGGE